MLPIRATEHATLLVELPFVSAYLDKFLTTDVSQWADLWESFRHFRCKPVEDKARFDACMRAYAAVQTAAAAKVLKTELLMIPNCGSMINLYPAQMYCGACATDTVPPQDFEIEHWEQIRVAMHLLTDDESKNAYDAELRMDEDPASQRRLTRRAILRWRVDFLDEDSLHERLEWLRNPDRCSCPCLCAPATHDTMLEERGYILLQLLRLKDDTEWAKEQVKTLREQLIGSADSCSSSFSINQVRAELVILQADIEDYEQFKATKRMNNEELEARARDIASSLEAAEGRELQGGPRQYPWLWDGPRQYRRLSPSAFTLHKAQLLEDLRCINTQVLQSATEKEQMHTERVRQKQEQLKAWELSGGVGTLRHAAVMVENILQDRTLEARCRLCSGPNNYDPERFCYTCEFPKCAACGLERSEAAGPRYKGKHMGKITKGKPWYERPTHRPSPGTQKIN